jgi:hypothetical protein
MWLNMNKFEKLCEEVLNKPDKRVTLKTLSELQSDERFNNNIILYHVCHLSHLSDIRKKGLIPKQPKSTTHSGILKGEKFKGVWLSSIDDLDAIVDIHMLPQKYYSEGRLLSIDCSQLSESLFSIGIEIPHKLMDKINNGIKISRNEYLAESEEIVYLDIIPSSAIKVL